jgi:hypothetical protein
MKNKKIVKTSLFFFIILFTNTLFSQEIVLPKNIKNISENENIIHLFSDNFRYEFDMIKNKISKPIVISNKNFDLFDYKSFVINDNIYFVHKSGGLVLKLVKNEIVRIDNSFDHKMQFTSSIFSYDGNIYKYGGYGFFSVRNFIVMYDFDSNEWESVSVNNDLLPPGRFDNGFFVRNDILYVVGGTTLNEYDTEKKNKLNDFWSFSFNLKEWKKIANNNFFKSFNINSFNFQNNIITKKNNTLFLLDIDNNSINSYKSNNTFIKRDDSFDVIHFNDNLYFVITRNNRDKVLIHRNIDEVFGLITSENKLNLFSLNFILISFLIIIILIMTIVIIIKYLNTIHISNDEIKFKNIKLSISQDEYNVLKYFYRNNYNIENSTLLKMIYKEQYDRTHNIRLKNNLVDNLNSKMQLLFKNNLKRLIYSKPSEFDKRFKTYFLDLSNFKMLIK